MNRFAPFARLVAFAGVIGLTTLTGPTSADVAAQGTSSIVIYEVDPAGSGASYGADWFELTNISNSPVNITGWKMDDSSASFSTSAPLLGVNTIAPGQAAIFFETSAANLPTVVAAFKTAWYGANVPVGLLFGSYTASGVGLSTSGDGVAIFDATGARVTGIGFGAANAGGATFDNTAGLGSTSTLPLVTTVSIVGTNAAFRSANNLETGSPGRRVFAPPLTSIDLSLYTRVGRYDLPEPTRTAHPVGNLLGQEASAVAYNWDTDTLFITGDGGTSIVQVSKTGQLIDTMTLAPGGSPQGTDFYDPEGITYVGNGQFVMSEERDRQAVLFTYVPGTTLTRAQTLTVKLGTFVQNIGLEGLSYDPQTGGFIFVKETQPQGIFQTGIDFAAGTATNGGPLVENSVDLFNPALLNLLDFADVFALSNLSSISGPESSHLLVLSQESAKIVHTDRNGVVYSTLTIHSDPDNILSAPAQQHEGMTMDGNGTLYVVSENGGGDFDHPQLWVYAKSAVPNQPPTNLQLTNQVNSLVENTSTATHLKVADVVITDDGIGTNNLTLSGPDAAAFDVDESGLYIKAGTALDFETKSSYSVTVNLDDPNAGSTPDASASYSLALTDQFGEVPLAPSLVISEVAPWSSGNSPVGADWFEVTNTGLVAVDVTGWKMDDSSATFAAAVPMSGISSIAPGESVIFIETANLASAAAAFRTTWFGANPPAALQIGAYNGGGVGLSTGGDAVNIYNTTGVLQAGVSFGSSPGGPSFPTFDNAAGVNNAAIAQLSATGVNGAFVAAGDAAEIGSPGSVGPVGKLVITEVAPWSSGNSPVGADWFEVTNTGAAAIDITGWKIDDSSESPIAAVPLSGVTSIAPGESAIFIETNDPANAAAAFRNTWFGGNPPPGLQIGSYTGGSVGLSTGGDAVNLYNGANQLKARVFFGAASPGPLFASFDNAAGVNNAAVSILSVAGINGAFVAADGVEIGSPGSIRPDTVPPTIDSHAGVVESAVDAMGARVSYISPNARDNVDLNVAVTCAPASGSLFHLGFTTVTCAASDTAHNTMSATFTVNVVDTTPPVLSPIANIVTTSTGAASAVVTFATSATDNVSAPASIAVVCAPPSGSLFPLGTTLVSCNAADEAGNPSAAVTFTVTVNVSVVGRFVALSRDLTWMRNGSTAVTGDVGAIERRQSGHHDQDTDDGDRDDVTVRIGTGATVQQASSRVVGDTVLLATRSSIVNVVDNFLIARRNSTVLGTNTAPMTVPFTVLPLFPAVQPGTVNVSVAKNKTATLTPGAYRAITVAAGGTLTLTGGLYQVDSIDLAQSATIVFHGATELRVRTSLSSRAKANLILDPAVAGLTPSKVVIYVAGRDEDCQSIGSDDDGDDAGAVTVHIGSQNTVQANIYAQRGTVWLKSKTRATGAFIGMHVRIGVNVELTLDSAFK